MGPQPLKILNNLGARGNPNLSTVIYFCLFQARKHLIDTGKAESLRRIDEALYCLVLCDTNPESSLDQSNAFLTGDARSRWHDKSFSMVITANSNMGKCSGVRIPTVKLKIPGKLFIKVESR